ncbi:HAD superfamily hydrolase, putative [Babesia bigemina]|uniref:HAD superfamily hydrolase, putative n=1 Tax=Babesia bigemina TaxID=5866 RepID=A0A061D7D3_BABBI|nr:HAD superfamily hydrolase, putative [Babesia bigemina]CDR94789.1 HAD superfamily hydrolase, putative [Babesia bigemina]|eukprot:XP_012766975.1 HAD superfamily hydrolase, putative [Babesia bigemina]
MDTAVQRLVAPPLQNVASNDLCRNVGDVSPYGRRLPRPALFAVDIDGTFLSAEAEVMRKNRAAFANTLKAGFNVFFCTGRPHVSSMAVLDEQFVRSTGYRGYPGVYHNGAVVYDGSGAVLRMNVFGAQFLTVFCEFLVSHQLEKYVAFCDMNGAYMLCDDSSCMKEILADVDMHDPPTVVTPADLLLKKISLLIVHHKEVITQQPHVKCDVDYVLKEGSFGAWDVTPCTSTKAEGLKVLLESYGVTSADCGFIGNGTNDVEAMSLCELSFAVQNAEANVQDFAKYTLAETNEEGAFHTVMKLVYGVPCE